MRIPFILLTLGLLIWPIESAQTPNFPLQGGVAQMPTRLCILHNFENKCRYFSPDTNCGPLVQDGVGVTVGALVQGPPGDDNFYGATPAGGTHDWGTIFRITPKGDLSVLYNFGDAGPKDGRIPSGGLTLGGDGNLYGTTYAGGKYTVGTIFKMPRNGAPTELLYSFRGGTQDPPQKGQPPPPPLTPQQIDDIAAGYPVSPPAMGLDGKLYGVSPTSNPGGGVLYRFDSDLKCLHRFKIEEAATNGLYPATLTQGSRGIFYGTTRGDDHGRYEVVFQFNPQEAAGTTGGVKPIYMFKAVDGSIPNSVIQGADGNLYGTTYSGGPYYRGVVFSLTLNGEYHILHPFGGNASNPTAGVVEVLQRGNVAGGPDPPQTYLYGAVAMGFSEPIRGPVGYLYRVRPDGTDFSVVYNFDGMTGAMPQVTPVLARDSTPYGPDPHAPNEHGPNLFGVAAGGGTLSAGVFYRLNIKYLVTGLVEANPTTQFENLVFQGSAEGKTWINSNDTFLQVATYMTAFLPTFIAKQHRDGITVRAKDANARFVQFFYRERLWKENLAHIAGAENFIFPFPEWQGKYDPATTYKKNDMVYTDANAKFQEWVSRADNNKNQAPTSTPAAWGEATTITGACLKEIHSCYPLTTDPSQPNWVPDAELPSPYYMPSDTQTDCDGVTIYDSPSFHNFKDIIEIFTGLDYVIVDGKVKETVRWKIVQSPGAQPQYTQVSVGGTPAPNELKYFRDLLTTYKFSVPLPF